VSTLNVVHKSQQYCVGLLDLFRYSQNAEDDLSNLSGRTNSMKEFSIIGHFSKRFT